MLLEELLSITMGKNVTRIKEADFDTANIYTNEDLLQDLNSLPDIIGSNSSQEKYIVQVGDVVYSLMSTTAAIVSSKNSGKSLNQNFVKLEVDAEQLDKQFLCYLLNESADLQKQMAISMQGSVVRKMTPQNLRQLKISLPDLTHQQVMGKLYFMMKRFGYLSQQEANVQQTIYIELLNKLNQSTI